MFCHKCGKEIVKDAAFCIYCGEKVAVPQQIKPVQNIDMTLAQDPVAPSAAPTDSYIKPIKDDACVAASATEAVKEEKKEESSLDQSKKQKNSTKESNLKSKTVLKIYADKTNKSFKERNLVVYVNNIRYNLDELINNSFGLDFDAKIVAYIDAPDGGGRIKSEELIIPYGKVVDVQITFENEILSAKVISEYDYAGSQTEANEIKKSKTRIRNRIIITITTILVIVGLIILADKYWIPRDNAKNLVESVLLDDAHDLYGESAEISKVKYSSIERLDFTDPNKYDLEYHLRNNTHFKKSGVSLSETKKIAYITKGIVTIKTDESYLDFPFNITVVDLPEVRMLTVVEKEETIFHTRAKGAVFIRLSAKIYLSQLNGSNLTISECTYTDIEETGYRRFKISGKITVKDVYGDFYTARYTATADFNNEKKDFDVNIVEIGDFYLD